MGQGFVVGLPEVVEAGEEAGVEEFGEEFAGEGAGEEEGGDEGGELHENKREEEGRTKRSVA